MRLNKFLSNFFTIITIISILFAPIAIGITVDKHFPTQEQMTEIRSYIKDGWKILSRSNQDILAAIVDQKINPSPPPPWPVYISQKEQYSKVKSEFERLLTPEAFKQIEIRILPPKPEQIKTHGLLYLPNPYVVPGGRFNEMYGWDSYFIILGLLQDGEIELAKNMTDNFIYEVNHYGSVLNANRTYYLTRSQPPFLTRMVLAIFQETGDQKWLQSTLPAIEDYYQYWTTPPKINPETGLSRYFDFGEEPPAEAINSEYVGKLGTHYQRVIKYFNLHKQVAGYKLDQFYDRQHQKLTPAFFKGDRSMRESGFDISHRFGPFNADIINYAPVCLNSLLYQMEIDTAEIYQILGKSEEAQNWTKLAQKRQKLINRYLWDEEAGLYFDYNFQSGQRRHYEFATTFYPLWTGIASPQQAQRVVNNLSLFAAPGGLVTSTQVTGNQWDAPFGWAPLQLIAVRGLRRYGYIQQSDRIARNFINLVVNEFEKHQTIVEKYDVVNSNSDVSKNISFGYNSNEIGFGWTNAVLIELLALLQSQS
jgi:alpha,alpha-trehalase